MASDSVELNIGGRKTTFTKSQTLVGLSPAFGAVGPALRAAESLGGDVLPEAYGGFELVEVAPDPDVERFLDELREAQPVAAGTHVYHTSDDEVPFVPAGDIFIQFRKGADRAKCEKLLRKLNLLVTEDRGEKSVIARVTAVSKNPMKTAAELQASDLVEVAEPDLATPRELRAFQLPTDEFLSRQWHLQNDGSLFMTTPGADARVVDAWRLIGSLGSSDIVIAVIDDGVDPAHPDLSGPGRVVAPADFSPRRWPALSPASGGWSGDWHGTACAGVALAAAGGGKVVGAAPNARLMPIRMGAISDNEVERYFSHARENGADVVSCSWGVKAKYYPLPYRQRMAIARCAREGRRGKGCVVVFAAGNSNRNINDPQAGTLDGFATHPDVIAVAACNSHDRRSAYSNFGSEISVTAPSSDVSGARGIVTSDVVHDYRVDGWVVRGGYSSGAYTEAFGGTSAACPLVAGICALVLSVAPQLKSSEVKQLLERTARKIGPQSDYNASGHSARYGYGCVNAVAAIRQLLGDSGDDGDHDDACEEYRPMVESVLDLARSDESVRDVLAHYVCGRTPRPDAEPDELGLAASLNRFFTDCSAMKNWFCERLS